MEEAERQLCDRLVVMDKEIVAEGSPRQPLIERYSTREVVELRFDDENGRPEDFGRWTDGLVSPGSSRCPTALLYTDNGDAAAHGIHERGLVPQRARPSEHARGRLPALTGRSLIE